MLGEIVQGNAYRQLRQIGMVLFPFPVDAPKDLSYTRRIERIP